MMWFESLVGFREENAEQVRANIEIENEALISKANGKRFIHGKLETPSLAELRERTQAISSENGTLQVREVVADVTSLHTDSENKHALFQVASQFNLLEMAGPSVTPEEGIAIYENDRTQGPACAIACGAGTIFRNYFASVGGSIGQTAENQIDCLLDLGNAMGNTNDSLWVMKNGYGLASEEGLAKISQQLHDANETERDQLRSCLRIGLQWNTEVTIGNQRQLVSQAFCSALPVSYSDHTAKLWADFAQLVLEASYEATFCAALLNMAEKGSSNLYLTLLGGGAFGNHDDWIRAAIVRSLNLFAKSKLNVHIVSHQRSKPVVQQLLQDFRASS